MEIPIKMDDLGVPPFSETAICMHGYISKHSIDHGNFQVNIRLIPVKKRFIKEYLTKDLVVFCLGFLKRNTSQPNLKVLS